MLQYVILHDTDFAPANLGQLNTARVWFQSWDTQLETVRDTLYCSNFCFYLVKIV
jgi:hypothetical protein